MIEVQDLHKAYRGRPAVNGLSFAVERGEIFGLLGPNGAGKTTTLSMLSTLLPPDSGRMLIGGHDLRTAAVEVKRIIGLVPQDLALYERLSAWENLQFFGRMYGLGHRTLRERCHEALAVVGLAERRTDPVRTFSGGMKRRLNIAAALLHRPLVLFLDEPTVGIDPQSRNFIFEFVERLRAEKYTLIYTTHYMEEAQRLCDRVAIMDHGEFRALDTPGALIDGLGGGIIHAGFQSPDTDTEELHRALGALPHVEQVAKKNNHVELSVRDPRAALAEIVELCQRRDVELAGLEVLKPDLEAVFLKLTGRRLRD